MAGSGHPPPLGKDPAGWGLAESGLRGGREAETNQPPRSGELPQAGLCAKEQGPLPHGTATPQMQRASQQWGTAEGRGDSRGGQGAGSCGISCGGWREHRLHWGSRLTPRAAWSRSPRRCFFPVPPHTHPAGPRTSSQERKSCANRLVAAQQKTAPACPEHRGTRTSVNQSHRVELE